VVYSPLGGKFVIRNVTRGVFLAAVAVALAAPAAQAAFPGGNGKIAFEKIDGVGPYGDIYLMGADGSSAAQLTNASDIEATWSPDGSKLAFSRTGSCSDFCHAGLWTIKADGSGLTRVTDPTQVDVAGHPAWSPDGRKIAFISVFPPRQFGSLYVVNADGSGLTRLASGEYLQPAWSPDGTTIVFAREESSIQEGLWAINPDGTFLRQLTNMPGDIEPAWSPDGRRIAFAGKRIGGPQSDSEIYVLSGPAYATVTRLTFNGATGGDDRAPAWSPDGSMIAFQSNRSDPDHWGTNEIFVMKSDGTDQVPLTNDNIEDRDPDWQPLRALAAYPRPGGASPLLVYLVPAYKQCTPEAQNSSHVAPLAAGSCSPPVQESSLLTTSSIGQMLGYVRLDVVVGNPSTPADEADVKIESQISDVRNASDQSDYAGQVLLKSKIRLTDRASGFGGVSATADDRNFNVPLSCTPTAEAPRGSTCELTTTVDALIPGFAKEGKRAVISTVSFQVLDAGPDTDVGSDFPACPPTCGTGDERTFLDQGVFAP
jgi:TolB protein